MGGFLSLDSNSGLLAKGFGIRFGGGSRVGSTRRSIAVRTINGQYIITPDNGTLTHIKRMLGIAEAREIDEEKNRLPNSGESYTFHGRDIYAYTGARLASGMIRFEDIGPMVDVESVVELNVPETIMDGDTIIGSVDILDVRFGSLWTNISKEQFKTLGVPYGGRVEISIMNDTRRSTATLSVTSSPLRMFT